MIFITTELDLNHFPVESYYDIIQSFCFLICHKHTSWEEMSYRCSKAASILKTLRKVEAIGFTYERKGTMIFFGYETGCCRGTTSNLWRKGGKNYLALPQVQNPVVYPQGYTHGSDWISPIPGFKLMCSRRFVFRKVTARSQVEIYRHFDRNFWLLLQDIYICSQRALPNPLKVLPDYTESYFGTRQSSLLPP